MWDAQGENLVDGNLLIYPEWVCQSVVKTVYFQLKCEYIGICRNVGYHLVKLVNVV